jgi:hypothetical protein
LDDVSIGRRQRRRPGEHVRVAAAVGAVGLEWMRTSQLSARPTTNKIPEGKE